MIKNYFKTAFRQLKHNLLYSIINIAGLATGITCMLLAIFYWKDEHSFDSFHVNNPDLYRITTSMAESKDSKVITTGGTGQVQGPAFKEAIPEIKSYVRILGGDIFSNVMADTKTLHIQPLFVDENFFDLFSFPLVQGNASTALNDMGAVVITETVAKKLFNSTDVIGKPLKLAYDPSFDRLGKPLMITAVVKDPPANSSLQFDMLLTFKFLKLSFDDNNWLNAYLGTFVLLQPGASAERTTQKLQDVFSKHAKEQLAENIKTYGYDPQIKYNLQPLTAIHLDPLAASSGNAEGGIRNGSSATYSWIFLAIAFFILLMAGINFVNISIASSLKRTKEVVIRKINGGSRRQIIFHFLFESVILCFAAFMMAILLFNIALPFFNNITAKQFHFFEMLDAKMLLYLLLLFVMVVLLSGMYPAFVLSDIKPVKVLSEKRKLSGGSLLGNSLVVLQFSLAIALLSTTLIYYQQMNFIRNSDIGYNALNIIKAEITGDIDQQSAVRYLQHELSKSPAVKLASFGSNGHDEEMIVNNRSVRALYKNADENYIPALDIKMQAGTNFTAGNTTGIIVNETFVKVAGLSNPLGTSVKINADGDSSEKVITGVVKDFHIGSLHRLIAPMVMYNKQTPDGGLWVKYEKANEKDAVAAVEKGFKAILPGAVFKFDYLNEMNANEYRREQKWQQVIFVATLLAFFICCLGLFGLAHLAAYQRIKEIGIRKVLGAGTFSIVSLLSAAFLKLVIIAAVIASPLAWLIMNRWLENFAYRVQLSWFVLLISVLFAVLIAFVTVSAHALKAALSNPVKNLRTE